MSLRCKMGFHLWYFGAIRQQGRQIPVRWCPRCVTYTYSRMGGKRYPIP